jgi:hypothetical protein
MDNAVVRRERQVSAPRVRLAVTSCLCFSENGAPMSEFIELYRGFEILVQVFPFGDDMVDVWCRIVNPTDPRASPLTVGVKRVDGGPFPAKILRGGGH